MDTSELLDLVGWGFSGRGGRREGGGSRSREGF